MRWSDLVTAGSQGIEPIGNSPEEFAQLIRSELPNWGRIVKIAGAKLD